MDHTRSCVLGSLRGKCIFEQGHFTKSAINGTTFRIHTVGQLRGYALVASKRPLSVHSPSVFAPLSIPHNTILQTQSKSKIQIPTTYTLFSPYSAPPLSLLSFTYKLPCSQILTVASSHRLLPCPRPSPLLILSAVLPSRVSSPLSISFATPGYPSSFSSFLDSVARPCHFFLLLLLLCRCIFFLLFLIMHFVFPSLSTAYLSGGSEDGDEGKGHGK